MLRSHSITAIAAVISVALGVAPFPLVASTTQQVAGTSAKGTDCGGVSIGQVRVRTVPEDRTTWVVLSPGAKATYRSTGVSYLVGDAAACVASVRAGYVRFLGDRVGKIDGERIVEVALDDSPFRRDAAVDPAPVWQGRLPIDVVQIESGDGRRNLGLFLGVWRDGESTALGRFVVTPDGPTKVVRIGSIVGQVDAIGYFPAPGANIGGLWIVRRGAVETRVVAGRFGHPAVWRE